MVMDVVALGVVVLGNVTIMAEVGLFVLDLAVDSVVLMVVVNNDILSMVEVIPLFRDNDIILLVVVLKIGVLELLSVVSVILIVLTEAVFRIEVLALIGIDIIVVAVAVDKLGVIILLGVSVGAVPSCVIPKVLSKGVSMIVNGNPVVTFLLKPSHIHNLAFLAEL